MDNAVNDSTASLRAFTVIGGGRMGEAIVKGLIDSGTVAAGAFTIVEPDAARRQALSSAYGVACTNDGMEAVKGAEIVLLAVKPQIIDDVVSSLASGMGQALVISIAAGISCARLESQLGTGSRVVRVMPNTPAMVGSGMSVVSAGSEASSADMDMVVRLFSAIGEAIALDERYQDAATAISGSGPAYVALFIDALARAGVRQGLSRDVAEALARQTLAGTVDLLEGTGMHPQQLIDGVSSPGGTTIAAIEALEAGGFRTSVSAAVSAAVKRSKELGS
ncbi:MAG: pyrroline-5-carboxylate reductase [Actinobacteria bacterium HGW-Actinobacteria-10]|jgi:pyrroline-5-carboxylate reductase|nr:MAG: pyrroline-5-carboxylate reductase [Actinobacteria bacterium HGW-Actinobacteria-10]